MVFLKGFVFLLFYIGIAHPSNDVFIINQVDINCSGHFCDRVERVLESIEDTTNTKETLEERIRISIDSAYVSDLHYTLSVDQENYKTLHIDIKTFYRINSIASKTSIPIPLEARSNIYYVAGPYASTLLPDFIIEVRSRLSALGHINPSVSYEIVSRGDNSIDIALKLKSEGVLRIYSIDIKTDDEHNSREVREQIKGLRGSAWDEISIRSLVEDLNQSLRTRGFYSSAIILNTEEVMAKGVRAIALTVDLQLGEASRFTFRGNRVLSRSELMSSLSAALIEGTASVELISNEILSRYETLGLYGTQIEVRAERYLDRFSMPVINYYVDILEGEKKRISEIMFTGNFIVDDEKLLRLYYQKATPLAKSNFYDENYSKDLLNDLLIFYYKKGHIFAEIDLRADTGNPSGVILEYRIRERQRVDILDINLKGVPPKFHIVILEKLKNRKGAALNITELDADIRRIVSFLHSKGYFFARPTNTSPTEMLEYDNLRQFVTININIDSGNKVLYDGYVVRGLRKTKQVVVEREISLTQGTLITSELIDELRQSLLFLGLFASVQISPHIISSDGDKTYVQLVINLEEKDFGIVELAPGFRTDVGAKLSADVAYNNLFGMNRSISLRTEFNQRLDFGTLDQRRRDEEKRFPEFLLRSNYSEPYLFNTKFQFDFLTSYRRRRFYSFDADIFRFSPQISRRLGKHMTVSLGYQFENIRQFDATEPRDNDSFQIGSIIPTISVDFRDNNINPQSGAHFSLSYEYAAPGIGSLDKDDFRVHFYKIISRNSFYFTRGGITFATLLSLGHERNLARDFLFDDQGNPVIDENGVHLRRGFIPGIKVFRLDGIDGVRGFSDREINRLINGDDLGRTLVQNEASYINLKFEPRYIVNDFSMIGLFYDAGRVFVDNFRPLDLRSSVGLTYKILTPVGTLDFDYGVKLSRQRDGDLGRERFGRFHLSIGHF